MNKKREYKILIEPIGYRDNGIQKDLNYRKFIKSYSSFKNAIKDRVQIVHLNWVNYKNPIHFLKFLLKIFIYKLFNIKIVFTIHNVIPHIIENYTMMFVQRKFLTKVADKFTFFSNNDMKLFEKIFKQNLENKSTIINYPPPPFKIPMISRKQARKELNLPQYDIIIIYYGGINWYKGVDDLIDIIIQIQEIIIKKVTLIIKGRCFVPDLNEIIKNKLKKVKSIIWIKSYLEEDKLSKYIIAADINAMLFKRISNSDTFCLGKRYPTKVIAPYLGSLPEHDKYGQPAYFYAPNNQESILKVMKKAIRDPPLKHTFIKDEFVKLEWNKMYLKFMKVYYSLLKKNELDCL